MGKRAEGAKDARIGSNLWFGRLFGGRCGGSRSGSGSRNRSCLRCNAIVRIFSSTFAEDADGRDGQCSRGKKRKLTAWDCGLRRAHCLCLFLV